MAIEVSILEGSPFLPISKEALAKAKADYENNIAWQHMRQFLVVAPESIAPDEPIMRDAK